MSESRRPRVLAVASGGGHWVQLMRLWPVLAEFDTAFVTVNQAYQPQVQGRRFYVVPDATRWNKLGLIHMAWRIWRVLRRERPDAILSTGAAPGYVALRLGKWLGARTLWLDSIANVEQVSLSGRRIGKHASLWLTQWSHLATSDGPAYRGAVL